MLPFEAAFPRAAALLEASRLALSFIEDEAENRSYAGSEYSDYEREPRELAERLRGALEPSSPEASLSEAYGDWTITYDPAPIPFRGLDYTYTHKDYDGAPDSGDRRCGYAGSVDECKADIDEIEAEAAPVSLWPYRLRAIVPTGELSACVREVR